jgi:hypothetical protein
MGDSGQKPLRPLCTINHSHPYRVGQPTHQQRDRGTSPYAPVSEASCVYEAIRRVSDPTRTSRTAIARGKGAIDGVCVCWWY